MLSFLQRCNGSKFSCCVLQAAGKQQGTEGERCVFCILQRHRHTAVVPESIDCRCRVQFVDTHSSVRLVLSLVVTKHFASLAALQTKASDRI